MKTLFNKFTQLLLILVITLGLASIYGANTGCTGGGQLTTGEAPIIPPAAIDQSNVPAGTTTDTSGVTTVGNTPVDSSVLIPAPVEAIIPPEQVSCPVMQEPFGGKGLSILRGDEPCEEFTAVNVDTVFLYPELFNRTTNEVADFIAQGRGLKEATDEDREMVGNILSKTKELDICRLPAEEDARLSEMKVSEEQSLSNITEYTTKLSSGIRTTTPTSASSLVVLAIARDNANFKDVLSDKSELSRDAEEKALVTEKVVSDARISTTISTSSFDTILTEQYFAIGSRTIIDNIRNGTSQSMEDALSGDFGQTPKTNLIRSFRKVATSRDSEESYYNEYGMIPEKILEVDGVSASSNNVCEESAVRINDDPSLFQRKVEVTELTSSAMERIVSSLELTSDESSVKEETESESIEQVRTTYPEESLSEEKALVKEVAPPAEEEEELQQDTLNLLR